MPAEVRLASGGLWRAAMDAVAEVGIALPWLWFGWLDYAVACHRWVGWQFALSIGVSGGAAVAGWLLVHRAAARYDDAQLGDLLTRVEDAPAWALFPHPAQILKREHMAWCRRRWGVSARTSGWQHFRRSWRTDAKYALTCLMLTTHALWSVW